MGHRVEAVIFDIGGVVLRSPLLAIAAYEREHGIPNNYINCSITRRGRDGAWQKFERGEIALLPFYDAFGRELSDTENGNKWYAEYCERKRTGCPELPKRLSIDGRELFGRMMRESGTFDDNVVEAIHRIRATKRWRVIALTNNFSGTESSLRGSDETQSTATPEVDLEAEFKFLGWDQGVVPPKLRELFDDFVDSSIVGMRKPEPEFYLYACKRNNVKPEAVVFLDDLGFNLKAAQELGMQTIHVPIGGSMGALKQLERLLGIDLTTPGRRQAPTAPSKL
ncbi:HAD-like protein [Dentipellis sp. KUC8613]|nr:HAD-like protein [Dentipellis sp. KUC8613]